MQCVGAEFDVICLSAMQESFPLYIRSFKFDDDLKIISVDSVRFRGFHALHEKGGAVLTNAKEKSMSYLIGKYELR